MAGKKNKKQPAKKKKHPGQPPAGQTVLAWEDDPQGNTPVSVPTPDPAEDRWRSAHTPRTNGRAVSARHGILSLLGGGRGLAPRRRFLEPGDSRRALAGGCHPAGVAG